MSSDVYTYEAPWPIYGMNWSVRPDKKFRLAMGSFVEQYTNKVEIVELQEDKETGKSAFKKTGQFDHPYPTTKIMWDPQKSPGQGSDMLATAGDYLRLWNVEEDGAVKLKCLFSNNKNSEFCAPLTSFDWNEADPNTMGTSSIDTTCTIWDVPTQKFRTQLIAHDKEVYDIAFAPSMHVFASAGADGSIRTFDLRSLEHSTIVYEQPDNVPLLRVGWNKQDPNYLATFLMEQSQVVILDIRVPSVPVAELNSHTQSVNAITWAPHSSCHMSSGGDDSQVLIWDLASVPETITDPLLVYNAKSEISNLQWSSNQPEWSAIAFDKSLQILRV
jgi:WD repeat-containing protein 68